MSTTCSPTRHPPRHRTPTVRDRCDICRAMLARADAPTATPCGRCGALVDGAEAARAFYAAAGQERAA